jgi:hypothetical protein
LKRSKSTSTRSARRIPDDKLAEALTKVAEDYKRLQAQVAALNPDNPKARELVEQAKPEIDAGHFAPLGRIAPATPRNSLISPSSIEMQNAPFSTAFHTAYEGPANQGPNRFGSSRAWTMSIIVQAL